MANMPRKLKISRLRGVLNMRKTRAPLAVAVDVVVVEVALVELDNVTIIIMYLSFRLLGSIE